MTSYFFDLDGTIMDATERFKNAGPEPSRKNIKRYKAWVKRVQNEESLQTNLPVPGMLSFVKAVEKENGIYFLTSREERWRDVTEQWLANNGFPIGSPIIMRPNDNWAETADYKEIAIKSQFSGGEDEIVVVDDDEKGTLEKVCKRNGWTFLKARSGGAK